MADSSPYPRQWTTKHIENRDGKHAFTLVTYNVLRDAAINPERYSYCPAEILYMPHRYPHIIKEIQNMEADIVCLQEVAEEQFYQNFQPDLGKLGYQGIYHTRMDGFGLATFYKTNVFQLIQQKHCYCHQAAETVLQTSGLKSNKMKDIREWIERPIAVLLAKFKHTTSGEILSVANLHVDWQDLNYPALQALQIAVSVNELVDFSNSGREPHIICGDFNTPSNYPGYQMLTDSHITAETKQQLKDMRHYDNERENVKASGLVDVIPGAFNLSTRISSAYNSVLKSQTRILNSEIGSLITYLTIQNHFISGKEPKVTCYGGEVENVKFSLDYIWFSQYSLDVMAVLETPPDSAITKYEALPSQLFPSDHISLKAEFVFRA